MATPPAPPLTPAGRAARIRARALALGFARVGITDLSPVPHAAALDDWLAAGYAGDMRYMHRQAARRRDPSRIADGMRRAVVVLYNYMSDDTDRPPDAGRVARYARGDDYHRALAEPLEELAAFTAEVGGPGTAVRWFVDAGPVPERELAQRAGLGWIGKNTMLIDPQGGSFTFIATVLTDADLAMDAAFTPDRCGSCTRCLDACPTGAFVRPRVLDARRCISYLTIEHRGPIPAGLARDVAPWVFGCDVCQDVCPWNGKFAHANDSPRVALTGALAWIPLDAFDGLDEPAFAEVFGQTPLERPGLAGMRRNAAAVRTAAAGTEDT